MTALAVDGRRNRKAIPVHERLWWRVDKRGADECWPWLGGMQPNGYGFIRRGRRGEGNAGCHVVAWECAHDNQPVPVGLEIDHLCHDPKTCVGGWECPHRRCCNPAHLSAVPRVVNLAPHRRRDRSYATHCRRGHSFDADNLIVRPNGSRLCRSCREAGREREHAKLRAARGQTRETDRRELVALRKARADILARHVGRDWSLSSTGKRCEWCASDWPCADVQMFDLARLTAR